MSFTITAEENRSMDELAELAGFGRFGLAGFLAFIPWGIIRIVPLKIPRR